MEALGLPGVPAEGRFYPDTYSYARGSSDLALLKRALHAMDRKLEAAWQRRTADSPLRTPQELLVLASIIEKETGRASDRPMISGVFVNRLRIGMPLQTDPTVIYGLGEAFDGNLRKRDLLADTPWNTYTGAACRPRRLPCRAGARCRRRCSRPAPKRFTLWRAATAAVPSAPACKSTIGRSTNTSASSRHTAAHHDDRAGHFHQFRGHRRGRQVQPCRCAGPGPARSGPHGDPDARTRRHRPGRNCARCCSTTRWTP